MPQVILPSIRDTDNPELKYQYLYDAYVKLRKELSYLLGNLDSDNVLEAQSVVADWVYAGSVTTDQLIAGEAKIGTALIEDLVVGGNVAMGPNARISWSQVTNQPTIPVLPSYIKSTYIDSTTVQSPTIVGGTIIGGSITSNSTINVNTDAYIGNAIYLGNYASTGKSIIFGSNAMITNPQGSWSLKLEAFSGVYITDLRATLSAKLDGVDIATVNDVSAAIAAHVAAYH